MNTSDREPLHLCVPGPQLQGCPTLPQVGEIVFLSFREALTLIELDLLVAIHSAAAHPLCSACEPTADLIANFYVAVGETTTRDCWEQMMCWRITHSWRTREQALIWLDDKVAQVAIAASLCSGRELHLPLYAHASRDDEASVEALKVAAQDCVTRGESFVIKPRHGANSRHIFLWQDLDHVSIADVFACVETVLDATDESWEKECWQLSQVPKGAVLQPMYEMQVPKGNGPKGSPAPMELKVQVLFSKVVGATLNTHPRLLWVTQKGYIQVWDQEELHDRKVERCRTLIQRYGQELPQGLLESLQRSLQQHWKHICDSSERLAISSGLDELRVDWLLGDERWGPRIGELTYMGAGSRLMKELSVRLARSFAAAHLCRLGLLMLEEEGVADTSLARLWPHPDKKLKEGHTGIRPKKKKKPVKTQNCDTNS